jgi:hypothetical protein
VNRVSQKSHGIMIDTFAKSGTAVMELIGKTMKDFFEDELNLLDEDIKEDSILSGFLSCVEEETIEFRQDNNSNTEQAILLFDRISESPGVQSTTMSSRKLSTDQRGVDDERTDFLMAEPGKLTMEIDDEADDEATDFLVARNLSLATIPNQISFKSNSRRKTYQPSNPQVTRIVEATRSGTEAWRKGNEQSKKPQDDQKDEIRLGGKRILCNPGFSSRRQTIERASRTDQTGRFGAVLVRPRLDNSDDERAGGERLMTTGGGVSSGQIDEKKNRWKLLPFRKNRTLLKQ